MPTYVNEPVRHFQYCLQMGTNLEYQRQIQLFPPTEPLEYITIDIRGARRQSNEST